MIFTLIFLSHLLHTELVSVYVVHRHGDRYPLMQIEGVPDSKLLGQLTERGYQRMENIGTQLRKRYIDTGFLKEKFEYKTFYFYSSPSERVKTSAFSLANGLFPPGTGPVFKDDLPIFPNRTQPIPLTSVIDESRDFSVLSVINCPRSIDIVQKYQKGSSLRKYYQSKHRTLGRLKDQTRHQEVSGYDYAYLTDALLILDRENLTKPASVTGSDLKEYKSIYDHLSLEYHRVDNPAFCNATTGLFMRRILLDINSTMHSGSPKYKFSLFAGHDVTINSIFGCIGLPRTQNPPPGSYVIIELHRENEKYYLEFSSDLDPSIDGPANITSFTPYSCPASPKKCEVASFWTPWKHIMAKTENQWFYDECGFDTKTYHLTYLIAATLLAVLFVAIMIWIIVMISRLVKVSSTPHVV
ncbi:putative histidine phosphatase family protein [Blattamonas nauphoetae]|uniref:Histidine phosphatase family protein n=1 Tax=Blattamonas nauphoetae TaxID=2049346 RepID=A0ABQ9X3L0_9EUKA|nr:putative histidine phosphatase family protein [Blattamonas nauphoetae]